MPPATPKKVTLQIEQSLLTDLKVYAVTTRGATFSNTVEAAIFHVFREPRDPDAPSGYREFETKYQHAGISSLRTPGRGRPSPTFLAKHGPIQRKKATFWLSPKAIRALRVFGVNRLRLDRSSFVNMAIKIYLHSQSVHGRKNP